MRWSGSAVVSVVEVGKVRKVWLFVAVGKTKQDVTVKKVHVTNSLPSSPSDGTSHVCACVWVGVGVHVGHTTHGWCMHKCVLNSIGDRSLHNESVVSAFIM